MSGKDPGPKVKRTQTLGAYTGEEAASPPSGGKRRADDDEHRGLAAFDRRKAEPEPAGHSSRGSSRWGGGAPSGPPPRKPEAQPERPQQREDDDLRRARLEAAEHDDDDMVPTSASGWPDDVMPAEERGGGRKKRLAKPEPEPEYEGDGEVEEEPPKKRSSAWKWVVGVLALGGAGVGAAIGISALRGNPAEVADAKEADKPKKPAPKPKPVDEEPTDEVADKADKKEAGADDKKEAGADDKKEAGADDKKEPSGDDKATGTTDKPAGEVADKGPDKAPDKAPDPAEETPTGPADWAPAAEALNAWVDVPAAPAGRVLGLSEGDATDGLAPNRTGFRPAAALAAPQSGYRIQSHEVTWGELALATTVPHAVTLTRPRWLPRDPSKLPATAVPWEVARGFCRGLGGDLPSEAEWEWAARGADDRYMPWGRDAVDTTEIRIFAGKPVLVAAVMTSKLDKTPTTTPIHDLLGNAQEWTRDAWRPAEPSAPEDARAATHKAVRGWPLADKGARIPAEGSTYRVPACADAGCLEAEAALLERVGFRCITKTP